MTGTLTSGDRLGDWVVESALGRGGMGSVYRCHSTLSPKVRAAVKVVALDPEHLGEARTRFVREIEVLETLSHPNIVGVRGGGEDAERSLLYLAMDLIDGQDLKQVCRGTAVSWREAAHVTQQLAEGLTAAHQCGIHHRDIKPANIMLTDAGRPVLIDFGIAIQVGQDRLTRSRSAVGTLAYLPPELFQGQVVEPSKADVYALGVVLWEMLTGSEAFPAPDDHSAEQRQARLMHLKATTPPLDPGPDFPDPLRVLLAHCTHPEPSRRLGSAADLARALKQLVGDAPIEALALTLPIGSDGTEAGDTFTLEPLPSDEDRPQTHSQSPFPWMSLTGSLLVATVPALALILAVALHQLGLEGPAMALSLLMLFTSPIALPIAGIIGLALTGLMLKQLRRLGPVHPGWIAFSVFISGGHLFQFLLGMMVVAMLAAYALGWLPESEATSPRLQPLDGADAALQVDRVNPSTTTAGASTWPMRSVSEHN